MNKLNRPLLASVSGALVFTALLLALPLGMSLGLQSWLDQATAGEVEIENIDFNPFTGVAILEQLHIASATGSSLVLPKISLDVDYTPLLRGQLKVASLNIEGLQLHVEQTAAGDLVIAGIKLPKASAAAGNAAGDVASPPQQSQDWGYALDHVSIRNSSIIYTGTGTSVEVDLDSVSVSAIDSTVGTQALLALEGHINGASLQINGALEALPDGSRSYAGGLEIGDFSLAALQALSGVSDINFGGVLQLDTQLSLTPTSDGLSGALRESRIEIGAIELRTSGERISGDTMTWQGDINFVSGDTASASASGSIQFAGFDLDSNNAAIQLASSKHIAVEAFSLSENGDISLQGLSLQDTRFGDELNDGAEDPDESAVPVLSASLIRADQVNIVGGNKISLGTLEWRDAVSVGRREEDGNWRIVRIFETLPFAEPDNADADQDGTLQIDELKLTGATAMLLSDYSVSPPFQLRLDLSQASLTSIDTSRPDQDSVLQLVGRVDAHSVINIKGVTRPFAEPRVTDLTGHIDAVPLTLLSPYTASAIGYELRSGQLDGEATFKLIGSVLDANNKLVFRGLETRSLNNEASKAFTRQLKVPLNQALKLLRDKNNTISLELPVRGDIEAPEFDANDAIATALSKSVRTGSLTFLKFALQPWGGAITLAQLAGDAAMKVRLEPLQFMPGSAERTPDQDGYLKKVATILQSRPSVNLKVCGIATPADLAAASKAELLELARQRAHQVKDRLITDYQVDARRLVTCQPEFDDRQDEAAPRVELLI